MNDSERMSKTLEEMRDLLKQMQVQQAEALAYQREESARRERLLDRAENVQSLAGRWLKLALPLFVIVALLLLVFQFVWPR